MRIKGISVKHGGQYSCSAKDKQDHFSLSENISIIVHGMNKISSVGYITYVKNHLICSCEDNKWGFFWLYCFESEKNFRPKPFLSTDINDTFIIFEETQNVEHFNYTIGTTVKWNETFEAYPHSTAVW